MRYEYDSHCTWTTSFSDFKQASSQGISLHRSYGKNLHVTLPRQMVLTPVFGLTSKCCILFKSLGDWTSLFLKMKSLIHKLCNEFWHVTTNLPHHYLYLQKCIKILQRNVAVLVFCNRIIILRTDKFSS